MWVAQESTSEAAVFHVIIRPALRRTIPNTREAAPALGRPRRSAVVLQPRLTEKRGTHTAGRRSRRLTLGSIHGPANTEAQYDRCVAKGAIDALTVAHHRHGTQTSVLERAWRQVGRVVRGQNRQEPFGSAGYVNG